MLLVYEDLSLLVMVCAPLAALAVAWIPGTGLKRWKRALATLAIGFILLSVLTIGYVHEKTLESAKAAHKLAVENAVPDRPPGSR